MSTLSDIVQEEFGAPMLDRVLQKIDELRGRVKVAMIRAPEVYGEDERDGINDALAKLDHVEAIAKAAKAAADEWGQVAPADLLAVAFMSLEAAVQIGASCAMTPGSHEVIKNSVNRARVRSGLSAAGAKKKAQDAALDQIVFQALRSGEIQIDPAQPGKGLEKALRHVRKRMELPIDGKGHPQRPAVRASAMRFFDLHAPLANTE